MNAKVVETSSRAHVRKASEFVVAVSGNPNDLHRAAHNAVVDYRLQDITADRVRCVGTMPGFTADKPTMRSPWHYHECELQLGVILAGSAEFGFETGHTVRCVAGEIVVIPGLAVHDVAEPSADYVVAELTFPGSFSTIDAPEPPRGTTLPPTVLNVGSALRVKAERGLVTYAHSLPDPHNQKFQVERERRSRVQAFEPAVLAHDEGVRILMVMRGTREVAVDGKRSALTSGDLLVLPGGGARWEDVAASEDYDGIWTRMFA
jgi:quercetin dioxygenase-like cupin family protein